MVANEDLLKEADTIMEASHVTYLESMLVKALGKTDMQECRDSIVKYKGRYGDDIYQKVLPQLKQAADSVLGDTSVPALADGSESAAPAAKKRKKEKQ